MGPCESYAAWDDIVACGVVPDIDEAMQDVVVAVATDIMFGLTGGRYTGECSRTVEPCWRGSCWSEPCRCTRKSRIDLGTLPVWGVDSVVIDDVELENTDGLVYWVEDWRWLVRGDGVSWPRCQGDWSITFQFGNPIPDSLRRATSLVGLELAKACAGGECALDARTIPQSREGVTFILPSPIDIVSSGFTGISFVDLILVSLGGKGGGGNLFDMAGGAPSEVSWTLEDA
jgi:hypothetical protein